MCLILFLKINIVVLTNLNMSGMWAAVLLRIQEASDVNLISITGCPKGLHGFIQAFKENVIVSQILSRPFLLPPLFTDRPIAGRSLT